jgi:hypothetical protein
MPLIVRGDLTVYIVKNFQIQDKFPVHGKQSPLDIISRALYPAPLSSS